MIGVGGTLPAIPTPLGQDRAVDRAALERILGHVFDAGVDGVVALGTSGEGISLDQARRRAVLRTTGPRRGSGTLVAGCAGNSVRAVLEAIEDAAHEGFDAALVPAPFYYPTSDAALMSFYLDVAGDAALPVVLYHIPERTKNRLSIASIRELAAADRIIGIKDSDGQVTFHLDLLTIQDDGFAVMQGLAPLVAWSYLHGASGAITPVSALFPTAELGVRRAIHQGDLESLREHAGRMNDAAQLFRLGGLPLVSNLKAVAELLGMGERWTEPPTPIADEEHLRRIADELDRLGWSSQPAVPGRASSTRWRISSWAARRSTLPAELRGSRSRNPT